MGTEDLRPRRSSSPPSRSKGFAAGQRLDDFDLLVELGKGAFASVFLARQVSMQRMVALKVSADKGNEPQTLAQLDHPNIVRVFDQRRLPEQHVRLLYMQFAPGGTLAEVVKQVRDTPPAARTGTVLLDGRQRGGGEAGRDRPRTTPAGNGGWPAPSWPETVCRLGIQLAYALDYAHRQGMLHRDVKPANVLLSADGSPKLADFNISFCSQLDGASPAAYFGGSLAYMSPEQLEACNPNHDRKPEDLDGRSDLYALAVMLWELLHGDRPFADEEGSGGWLRHARRDDQAPPHRTSRVAPAGPRDPITMRLEQVLRKTLVARPSQAPRRRHGAGPRADALPQPAGLGPGQRPPQRLARLGPPASTLVAVLREHAAVLFGRRLEPLVQRTIPRWQVHR